MGLTRGSRILSDAVHSGRNFDKGSRKDDRYVRCSRCGWICHLDRDMHIKEGAKVGWGSSYTGTYSNIDWDDSGTLWADTLVSWDGNSKFDEKVTGGCPNCGTFLYKGRQ